MIYVTSDNHFGHEKIMEYEHRPFNSVAEMDSSMIDNWNRVVCRDDYVIHFGDFSLLPPDITIRIVKELQGKIILINGNHDHRSRTFWEQRTGILKWFKRPQHVGRVWLTHRVHWHLESDAPYKIFTGKLHYEIPGDDEIVLHGHTHSKIRQNGKFINVGVDAWEFMPVPLSLVLPPGYDTEIEEWIKC